MVNQRETTWFNTLVNNLRVSCSLKTDGSSLTALGMYLFLHCQRDLTTCSQLRPTPNHRLRRQPPQTHDRTVEQVRTEHHQESYEGYAYRSCHDLELVIPS